MKKDSKNLIIVLIIIVAIVISLLGIRYVILPGIIHKQASDTIYSMSKRMEEEEEKRINNKEKFNSEFSFYAGNSTGKKVKELINKVKASNDNNEKKIKIEYNNQIFSNNEILSILTLISDNNNYKISFDYDVDSCINLIKIKI